MNDRLLDIDVRLMVLRYGRQRLLTALARLGDQTPEQLEQELRKAERKPESDRTKKSNPQLVDVVSSVSHERPEIAEPLRVIAVNFGNGVFLPRLRDVQRFLDRIGATQGKLRSRAAAGPVLMRALARLTQEELVGLAERDGSPGESDYSLLSRAIMGAPGGQPRQRGVTRESGTALS